MIQRMLATWSLVSRVGGVFSGVQDFLVGQKINNSPSMQETQVQSLGWEDALGKEMATHSSILA